MKAGRRVILVVGLIISLGVPCLPIGKWVNEFADVRHLVLHEVVWWGLTVLMLEYVVLVEQRPLRSLGFRTVRMKDLAIAVAAALVILVCLILIQQVLFPLLHVNEDSSIDQLESTPLWWRLISVVRAGVSEEVLFRGYGLERTHELTGSRAFAAGFTVVVFTLAHVPAWGWSHVLIAGTGGSLLTALYLWRRNLWVNIIAHTIVDGVAVVAG
jgi:membrane protease YdiL (CAAX protease family)